MANATPTIKCIICKKMNYPVANCAWCTAPLPKPVAVTEAKGMSPAPAKAQATGFVSCACHVFGIAGYVSDEQAANVNTAYASAAAKLPKPANAAARAENLKSLIQGVRTATGTADSKEECIIYGGFTSKRDTAPSHIWVEWKGDIYDTMPGHPLRKTSATSSSRAQPPCENAAFKPDDMGACQTVLTTAQLNNITKEKTAGPVWE